MKRIIFFFVMFQFNLVQYGQIIADHTVVDKFDNIPLSYINEVKKMWLVVAGESHSAGYRAGLTLLESLYPLYDVNITTSGTPEGYNTSHLRASSGTWGDYDNASGWIYYYGEEDFFTNALAIARTKAGLAYCNSNNLTVSAFGFGWCWDATRGNATAGIDPVYGVHWRGQSINGPEGNLGWGLDAGDQVITGNSVSMDTYLNAVEEYIAYCATNNINTKVFFTTGPVEDSYNIYEAGYVGSIKYQYIRDYVSKDATRILFDYADILCYDDNGALTTATWNGHTFPIITPTNLTPDEAYHISQAGAIRLAKAMWWMLARMAGWNGISIPTGVSDVEDNGESQVVFETSSGRLMVNSAAKYVNGRVGLYSINGNLIESRKIYTNLNYFNTSLLPSGLYIVLFSKDNLREAKKVVKIN